MKRVFAWICAVCLTALVSFAAFADAAPPDQIGYDVVIGEKAVPVYSLEKDANGAQILKQTSTLAPGAFVRVLAEMEIDGQTYCAVNGLSHFARKSDLMHSSAGEPPAEDEAQKYVLLHSIAMVAVDPNGVALRTGPADSYAVVTTAPHGARLQCEAVDAESYDTASWMYCTYQEQSGWVRCSLTGDPSPMAEVLPDGITGTARIVRDNVKLLDGSGNAKQTLLKGEKLTYTAFTRTPDAVDLYVTYKGKDGFLSGKKASGVASSLSGEGCTRTLTFRDAGAVKLFRYPEDRISLRSIQVAADEALPVQSVYYASASGDPWVLVEKKGQSGWCVADAEQTVMTASAQTEWPTLPILVPPPRIEAQETELATEIESALTIETAATEPATEETTDETTTVEEAPFDPSVYFELNSTTEAAEQPERTETKITLGQIVIICAIVMALLGAATFVSLQVVHKKDCDNEP